MKFVIKPSGSFFKPSPWRLLSSPGSNSEFLRLAGQTARYLIIEVCKTKADAAPCDNPEDFATSDDKVKKQGTGFHLPRLLSGQVTLVYVLEFAVDRQQIYVASALDKVCYTHCWPVLTVFLFLLFSSMIFPGLSWLPGPWFAGSTGHAWGF
jgi:hypothetical protein